MAADLALGLPGGLGGATSAPEPAGAVRAPAPLLPRPTVEAAEEILDAPAPPVGTTNEPSRTAYAGLSDEAALAQVRESYPGLLSQPAWSPPSFMSGERLVGWEDDNTATVKGSSGPTATLHSATPIRSSVGSGQPALVDNTLALDGGAYRPANPLTPYTLPDDLGSPFGFSEAGLGVRFADARQAQARRVETKLAYANAWEDTDLVVDPLPDGFAATQVLRSERSPEAFAIELDLPAGAELVETGGEPGFVGAAVVLGSGTFAISPPHAWDLAGQTVPTEWRVMGEDTLELAIDHRGGDFRFPIQLDPSYTYVAGAANSNYWGGWQFYNPAPSKWTPHLGYSDHPLTLNQYGLFIVPRLSTVNPGAYGAAETAFWYWTGLGSSRRVYRYASGGLAAHQRNVASVHGVMDAPNFGRWIPGTSWVDADWRSTGSNYIGTSPWLEAGATTYVFRSVDHCFIGQVIGEGHATSPTCSLAELAQAHPDLEGRVPAFAATFLDGTRYPNDQGFGFMNYAYAWTVDSLDVEPPTIDPPRNTSPPTISGTPREGEVLTANKGTWTGTEPIAYDYQWRRCNPSLSTCTPISGARADRHLLTNADVGSRIRVTVTATNAAKIEGPVWSEATGQVGPLAVGPEPETTITAGPNGTSGDNFASFEFTSSIAGSSFECRLDSPDWTSCTSPKTYTQLVDGPHEFAVRARSPLGSKESSPASRSFGVDADLSEPVVSIDIGTAGAGGSFPVTITATDPPEDLVTGSGVEELELLVDGKPVQTWEQSCPGGGCSMTRTTTLSASESASDHEIAAIADDRSGNTEFATRGAEFRPYNHFGYNDNFEYPRGQTDPARPDVLNERLMAAIEGGARMIRFPVDWCSIAPSPIDEFLPPAQWSGWGTYDPIFNAVKAHNQSTPGTDDDVLIVAEFLDSPSWASGVGQPGECAAGAAPPDAAHLDDWNGFIDEALRRWANLQDPQDAENGIRVVEAWNEPNLPGYWGGGGPDYAGFADLVNRAASAVGSLKDQGVLSQDVQVLPGGTSPVRDREADGDENPRGGGNFWRATLPLIDQGAIDGVSVHLYPPTGQESVVKDTARGCRIRPQGEDCVGARQWIAARYDEARNGIDAVAGYVDTPIWITEIGFPTNRDTAGVNARPVTQSRRLLDAYRRLAREVPAIEAFLVHNVADYPGIDPDPAQSKRFGVLDSDFMPKNGSGRPPRPENGAYCRLARQTQDPDPDLPQCR